MESHSMIHPRNICSSERHTKGENKGRAFQNPSLGTIQTVGLSISISTGILGRGMVAWSRETAVLVTSLATRRLKWIVCTLVAANEQPPGTNHHLEMNQVTD